MDSFVNKVIEFGAWAETIGDRTNELGTTLMPYSFFVYLFYRYFLYKTGDKYIRYNNLIKSIWYIAYGSMLLTDDLGVDLVVMLIAFIEGVDLFFKYLEDRKRKKAS